MKYCSCAIRCCLWSGWAERWLTPITAAENYFVLVITVAEKKFGLIVDALDGEEELVIKALDDQTFSTDLVAGASILGDGRVVLILNLPAVVEQFARTRPTQAGTPNSGLLLTHTDRARSGRWQSMASANSMTMRPAREAGHDQAPHTSSGRR